MKTLILLIDFYGHPALTTDKYNDSIRYSALTEIISSSFIDRKNCAIFSTSIPQNDKRLLELKQMATLKGFPFVTPIPGTNDVPWDEKRNLYASEEKWAEKNLKPIKPLSLWDKEVRSMV